MDDPKRYFLNDVPCAAEDQTVAIQRVFKLMDDEERRMSEMKPDGVTRCLFGSYVNDQCILPAGHAGPHEW